MWILSQEVKNIASFLSTPCVINIWWIFLFFFTNVIFHEFFDSYRRFAGDQALYLRNFSWNVEFFLQFVKKLIWRVLNLDMEKIRICSSKLDIGKSLNRIPHSSIIFYIKSSFEYFRCCKFHWWFSLQALKLNSFQREFAWKL